MGRVKSVVDDGVKEIWLSSEDTGAYGTSVLFSCFSSEPVLHRVFWSCYLITLNVNWGYVFFFLISNANNKKYSYKDGSNALECSLRSMRKTR